MKVLPGTSGVLIVCPIAEEGMLICPNTIPCLPPAGLPGILPKSHKIEKIKPLTKNTIKHGKNDSCEESKI